MPEKTRCDWANAPLLDHYHDTEWGVPLHDDRLLFEHLILDGAQAGLSWLTILKKRAGYAKAFADFDVQKVARFRPARLEKLMLDPGIVRNRLKIESAVNNARRVIEVQQEFGSLDAYLWQFVAGRPIQNRCQSWKETPATSKESDAMSKDMKQRGFKFCGSTICYAIMQATGMVNDHVVGCFRHEELRGKKG
ncbi:MAG TPA: DNA-3-methyladenine glycosylase I [Bryobacterales bacterium]|nr:DNA-3-methyladenine glycosylase I [Bryobacterales bacterium]